MTDIDRLLSKAVPEPNTGCLLWLGCINEARRGYGLFHYARRTHFAHRVAWLLQRGSIPRGMFVCHRCDTPSCINVDHLFLGTAADNNADKMRKGRHSNGDPITHCKHGHLYTPENTMRVKGGRWCRTCSREAALARYHAKHPKCKPRGVYKKRQTVDCDHPRAELEIVPT